MPPIYEVEAGLTRSNATRVFPDTKQGFGDALDAGLLHAFIHKVSVEIIQFSPRTDEQRVLYRYNWSGNMLRPEPVICPTYVQEKPQTVEEVVNDDPLQEYEGCVAG